MKKEYQTPDVTVVKFDNEDIITSSDGVLSNFVANGKLNEGGFSSLPD